MKQRVIVQAIVQNDDKILLLRRSQGRESVVGKYELPGGTLEVDEQPEDGIKRHLHNDTGLIVKAVRLHDVMAMNDREENNIQHVFVVYIIDEISSNEPITVSQSYDTYQWKKKSEIQQNTLRDSALYLLGLYDKSLNKESSSSNTIQDDVNKTTNSSEVIIYSDGGSRGNPGPSAAAFVIMDKHQNIMDQDGVYLGITTNNQAEYHGVRLGLERALELGVKSLEFRVDSMLVLNQLKGTYKIKNRELWPVNERIVTLVTRFDRVKFTHVPRELNQLADALVNKVLDEHKNDQV